MHQAVQRHTEKAADSSIPGIHVQRWLLSVIQNMLMTRYEGEHCSCGSRTGEAQRAPRTGDSPSPAARSGVGPCLRHPFSWEKNARGKAMVNTAQWPTPPVTGQRGPKGQKEKDNGYTHPDTHTQQMLWKSHPHCSHTGSFDLGLERARPTSKCRFRIGEEAALLPDSTCS